VLKIVESLWAVGAPNPAGELTCHKLVVKGLMPLPKNPTPLSPFGHSVVAPSEKPWAHPCALVVDIRSCVRAKVTYSTLRRGVQA